MQTIEMIAGLTFAIIVGVLIIQMITGINLGSIYHSIEQLFNPPNKFEGFAKVGSTGILQATANCWEKCRFGQQPQECSTVLVQDKYGFNDLNVTFMREQFEKLNYCTSCKLKVIAQPITLPRLINISCRQVCAGCPDYDASGTVDDADKTEMQTALGLCTGDGTYDPLVHDKFDLDGDACITEWDMECMNAALWKTTTCGSNATNDFFDDGSTGPDAKYNGIVLE